MSDNLRRYRAIRNALTQAYPTPPTGNFARHLHTLAALISGIVGGKSTQRQFSVAIPKKQRSWIITDCYSWSKKGSFR